MSFIPEHGARRLHIRHMGGAELVEVGLDQQRANEHGGGDNEAYDAGREGRTLCGGKQDTMESSGGGRR